MDDNRITCAGINLLHRAGRGALAALVMLAAACDHGQSPIDQEVSLRAASIDVIAVATGEGTACAVLDGGEVRCWGQDHQTADGPMTANSSESVVLDGARQVRTNGEQTVVVMNDGTLLAWGSIAGESCDGSGDGDAAGEFWVGEQPVALTLGQPTRQVAVGADFACGLQEDGSVRCWGNNACGQLGRGDTQRIGDDEPLSAGSDVELGEPAVELSAGAYHTCARLESGAVRCWGLNADGQLGRGHTDTIGDNETPKTGAAASFDAPAQRVVAGVEHSCALLESGAVRCWGSNADGQLGYGKSVELHATDLGDVSVGGLVEGLAAGARHTCALLEGGSLRCWGNNDLGQLGYGHTQTIGDDETPAEVAPVDLGEGHAVAVYSGSTAWNTFAVLDHGGLRGWGHNDAGQLGYGHTLTLGDDTEEPPGELPDILVDHYDIDDE